MERLHDFAQICIETKGASFSLTKLKTGEWQITIINKGTNFKNKHLELVIEEAHDWVKSNRKPIELEVKYTLFD